MHFFNRYNHTLLETDLTEGMGLHIGIADTFPDSSIPTAYSRISVILLVACVFLFRMLFTISSFSKVRTSWYSTWLLRFSWHRSFLLPGSRHNKSPGGFYPTRLCGSCLYPFSLIILYHDRNPLKGAHFRAILNCCRIFWYNKMIQSFIVPSANSAFIHIHKISDTRPGKVLYITELKN